MCKWRNQIELIFFKFMCPPRSCPFYHFKISNYYFDRTSFRFSCLYCHYWIYKHLSCVLFFLLLPLISLLCFKTFSFSIILFHSFVSNQHVIWSYFGKIVRSLSYHVFSFWWKGLSVKPDRLDNIVWHRYQPVWNSEYEMVCITSWAS